MISTRQVALVTLGTFLAMAFGCATAEGVDPAVQTDPTGQKAVVESGGVQVNIDRDSTAVQNIRVGEAGTVARWPLAGFVEVADLHDRRVYNPIERPFAVSDWAVTGGEKPTAVTFTQQYDGAPFAIDHRLSAFDAGVRWQVAIRLLPGQTANRSVRVSWLLPAPNGWRFWTPKDTTTERIDGVSTSRRTVYGHAGFSPYGTIIPLAGIFSRNEGLAAWSPPDITKTQITFEIDQHGLPDTPRGVSPLPEERPRMRIDHHLVGLRPGKPLTLAICLGDGGTGWRTILGRYVRAYPELFEPLPAVRKIEGMYAITGLGRMTDEMLKEMAEAKVTFVEFHGSFKEYSVYLTREMIDKPETVVVCKPHPEQKVSVANNRAWIDKAAKAGIAPFMYFYNCHALPATIAEKWPGATFMDERGRPLLKWYTEPSVYGPADSPYGRDMLRQMDLMLEAYPDLPGFFIDNFGIEMISFAHDDGVTMVHDRPAYDLNRNHQELGPRLFAKAHAAGRLIMINKLATIESARGGDMLLAELSAAYSLKQHGMACVFRPIFPLGMGRGTGADSVERAFQHLLTVGGTPEWGFYRSDPETTTAYRPLTDAMTGRRWVLDAADPVTFPAGFEGNIFRIDQHAPHPGDVVISIVHFERTWKDKPAAEGLSVTVRLPENDKLTAATFLPTGKDAKPVACKIERKDGALTVQLPPVGAAGVVRLSP